jgi:hypothetical protein
MTRENCLPFSDKWARIPADSIPAAIQVLHNETWWGLPLMWLWRHTSFGGNWAIWHVFGAYELWSRISSQVKENLNSSYL